MSDEELKRLHARLNELDFERKEIVLKIANIQKQTTVFADNSILNQVPETLYSHTKGLTLHLNSQCNFFFEFQKAQQYDQNEYQTQ